MVALCAMFPLMLRMNGAPGFGGFWRGPERVESLGREVDPSTSIGMTSRWGFL
jgi:hypothetical protein